MDKFVKYEKKVILDAFTTEELIETVMSRDKDALTLMIFKLAKKYDELKKEYDDIYVPPTSIKFGK